MSSRVTGIFVPGLCCRSEIWEGAAAGLPGVDVVALDWPWPERLRSYDDAADWLAHEIAQRRPRYVVGHSFGGIVALHLASRTAAPPAWQLVIVESFLVTPHPFFRNHVWRPTDAVRERVAAMLAEERPRFPVLREVASADDPPGWHERALAVGAGYVFGGRSGEHAPATLGEMAGVPARTGHAVRVVDGAAHFPMLEEPEALYGALAALLAKE